MAERAAGRDRKMEVTRGRERLVDEEDRVWNGDISLIIASFQRNSVEKRQVK